jgi:hypothetical protein
MLNISDVPTDLDAFLHWFRERTEAAWADFPAKSFADFEEEGVGGQSWRRGTKWQAGLEAAEIDALERQWNLKFPEDYRRFLAILNAPDQGMYSVGWSDDPPYGMEEDEDGPSFYDWRGDKAFLDDALGWPLEGLLFDVENNSLWPDSWGKKPQETEIEDTLSGLVSTAPKLLPIIGHRYLLGDPVKDGNPVLSVWQSDIIVYGSDLRHYLMLEFSGFLGIAHDDLPELCTAAVTADDIAAIPFWGELMLRE